jgi:hypothetical protein
LYLDDKEQNKDEEKTVVAASTKAARMVTPSGMLLNTLN